MCTVLGLGLILGYGLLYSDIALAGFAVPYLVKWVPEASLQCLDKTVRCPTHASVRDLRPSQTLPQRIMLIG